MPCRTLPLLAALLLLTALRPTSAQTPAVPRGESVTVAPGGAISIAAGKIVSLDVADADLPALIGTLERESNVWIEVQDGAEAYRRVTLRLEDVPLPDALKAIAQRAGAVVGRGSHGGYLLHPLNAQPQPPNTAALPATQVYLKVKWVYAPTEEIDRLTTEFVRLPFTAPTAPGEAPAPPLSAYLESAAGDTAVQAYHSLTRASGRVSEAPQVWVRNGEAANLGFETRARVGGSADAVGMGLLTFAARLNADNSITLDVQEQVTAADAPPGRRLSETTVRNAFPHVLRTVPSGGLLVLRGPLTTSGRPPAQETLTFIRAYAVDRNGHAINDDGSVTLLPAEGPAVTVTP